MANLIKFRETIRRWLYLFKEFVLRLINYHIVKTPIQLVNSIHTSSIVTTPENPFLDCDVESAPFEYPIFVPFLMVRHSYLSHNPLFLEIIAPQVGELPPGAINFSTVQVRVLGQGKTAWISAVWCFIPPERENICGFEITTNMSASGILQNNQGGYARIKMESSIAQYRTDKSWDEVHPARDIPYRYVRSTCVNETGDPFPEGFFNNEEGQHIISKHEAKMNLNFSFSNRSGCMDVQKNDQFQIGYWCEIDLSDQSIIDLSHEGRGTLVMNKPSFKFFIKP